MITDKCEYSGKIRESSVPGVRTMLEGDVEFITEAGLRYQL